MKLIYALWGSGLDTALRSTQLHTLLRAAGVSRLQINVDDSDVEEAMLRITTFDKPVPAVVSVWTDTDVDPEPISDLLAAISQRSAGWEVEETVRLVPPAVENGVRTTALAQIGFLRIPPDLDPDQWLQIWQGQHTSVAIETQDTFGYVQNRVLRTVHGADRVDAVVEELFPMAAMTDMHAFYGSGGDDAELQRRITLMVESVTRFGAHTNLDSVPTSRYCFAL
ncbi:hypothetical protein FZI85_14115 [Mycobacterium sp. CBMA293]|uniref:EthD domain-containing protein n=1 Tax=unclassified Mycolicibacterium TaxID=2636767 RepID=UPI0012DC35FC|nr:MULTISPECIES: EthD domain-containing protein [unclassified Mycolicibacterium]MUL48157.1 hypothetical protein [Mycolicibacterium sp. CBMA 360]MUL57674.1 hypothetical protein [Mycolicibacterium sp. CBMA 335]MUL70714.1 hypothetical protein [Mycolicibacterium sp. CBMA 311]MUL92762.1 hypothetical protein [Mycolicibacterium sp. CBMA 230]MUM08222.1 hypothetical protein [Mycolicibacterium sp. CBMA 213]